MRKPEQFRIFDLHHHVGTLEMVADQGAKRAAGGPEEDIRIRLEFMDAHGIEQALLMPANGYPAPDGLADTIRINTAMADYRNRHPDRFPAALGTVSPLEGDGALDEIDRCIEVLGMRGIVWHHRFQGSAIDHPRMQLLLEHVQHHKVPAFIHIIADSNLESPWKLEMTADRFPELTFVALDGFSSPDHAHWMPYLASKHPNIVFDTGVMIPVSHMLENFVAKVGAERLLLGTDFYSSPKLFSHPFPVYEILHSDLSDAQCAAILGDNARRLLRLD
ncbi:MAG: amidohydrolase family protein [Rhizobiaceae bacterium]